MIIFNDNLEMHWDNVNGVPHGHGYGIGETYILVGEFIRGTLWGDVHVYDKVTGKRILLAEFEASLPHGNYTMHYDGIAETGMYKDGNKHFVVKRRNGIVFEYGFCKNNEFHGYACIESEGKTYTSPYWDHGVINGLGCIQDANNHVIFYGLLVNSIPVMETNDIHPLMLHKYELAKSDLFSDLPRSCAEFVLCEN